MIHEQSRSKRIVLDILLGAGGSALFALIARIFDLLAVDIIISIAVTFFLSTLLYTLLMASRKGSKSINKVGLIGVWQDESHFNRDRGISYASYCTELIKRTPDDTTVRIVGYDWAELLSNTTTLSDEILLPKADSRLNFKVLLADPNSLAVIEKRAWEMNWKSPKGEYIYPEGRGEDSLKRLKIKVAHCVTNAKIFTHERPNKFELKLTPTFLNFSFLMTQDALIGTLYALPHKGKATIVFEARRVDVIAPESQAVKAFGGGIYGFMKGYFESLWSHPEWQCIETVSSNQIPNSDD